MAYDRCINCGHQFRSEIEADEHNWCCRACLDSGGIDLMQDPFDPDIAITPTGFIFLPPPP